MQKVQNGVSTLIRFALVPLGFLAWLGLSAGAWAQSPPPNDQFASAIAVSGFWGTTNGSNVGATAQTAEGEPSHAGSAAAASVWYQFVPIQDGTLTVHTFGSDFSTRLAVYSGFNNTNATVATLFPVAANVALNLASVHGPTLSGPGSSIVRFPVKLGTVYYIAVDGVNGATGNYALTWAYNFAGIFYMTQPQVEARKDEGSITFYVSRLFGSAGRVQVKVMTTPYAGANTPATAGTDYLDTQRTLFFDDFETLSSFTVPIIDAPFNDTGDTNAAPFNPNYYFSVTLTNAQLGFEENPDLIAPPVVLQSVSSSEGRMLEREIPFGFGDPGPTVSPFTNSVINFRYKHFTGSENLGYVRVYFTRTGTGDPKQSCSINWHIDSYYTWGDLMNNQFALSPESDYATPTPPTIRPPAQQPDGDFVGSSGNVSWGANDFMIKYVDIPVTDDMLPEFSEDFEIELTNEGAQNCVMGELHSAICTILGDYRDQPAGGLEAAYNNHNQPPNNPVPGANAPVYAIAVQPDQSAIIGGDFTAYNAQLRNRIARITFDGALDDTFDPGNGADGLVSSVALQPDGRILLAGDFFAVGGVDRFRVARLNPNGSVDLSFNPGVGADDTVWSMALTTDNPTNQSVIIGGLFYSYNDYPCTHVARLDPQGNLDQTFDTSELRINGPVWAVAPQPDGKVVIGGSFTAVNGFSRPRIARLNADGSLDLSFDPALGADDSVFALLVQADGNILVGGAFSQFHTAAHRGVTRLKPTGALDPTFSPGSAANGVVRTLYLSAADSKIYVGGNFTSFNGTRRLGLARLFYDGTVDTSFLDTAYNHFAGFPNSVLNPDLYPPNSVYAIGVENVTAYGLPVQDILVGGSFSQVGGGGGSRHSRDIRQNLTLLRGGATEGPGNLTLSYPTYSVDENQGGLQVTLTRTNGTLGIIGARFSPDPLPVGPGAALYGKDYTFNPVNYGLSVFNSSWGPPPYATATRMLSDGIWNRSFPDPRSVIPYITQPGSFNNAYVNVPDNNVQDGNRSFGLSLTIPWQADTFFLGGADIPLGAALGARPTTSTTIVDEEKRLGTFTFVTTNYAVSESIGTATIQVLRTNGADLDATLYYKTYDLPVGPTSARSNINYSATSGTLIFRAGRTSENIYVPILPDHMATRDLSLLLVITNFSKGVKGGITNAFLTIIDGDSPGGHLNFSAASFVTNETAGAAVITVTRTGSSQGTLTVLCSTTSATPGPGVTPAAPGTNYTPVTSLLVWTNGDSAPKSLVVPLLQDRQVTPNLTVGLTLSSPTLNGLPNPTILGPQSAAALTILNEDYPGALSFSSPIYRQNENGGFAVIPVVRRGGHVGNLTASFSTLGLNASPGVDYLATNGPLAFGDGEVSKIFTVPLVNNTNVADLAAPPAVVLTLTGSAGTLGYPSTATLDILDDENYNEPPGDRDIGFRPVFDGPIHALGLQPNGSIVVGGSFTVANSVTRHRLARILPNGSLDYGFPSQPAGADGSVRTLALQSDGRILIGGDFTNYQGVARSRFARVNFDGTLDWQFDPGSALDQTAYAIAETFTDTNHAVRKILVGGAFTIANGAPRRYLAQFTDSGSTDLAFDPAAGSTGIDGPVWAIAIQPDRKIIIGGDFQSINGVSRPHIARLYPNGALDLGFDPGAGANDSVRALALQLDGRILVGGLFTNFNGAAFNRIARLNADGTLDSTFNVGSGADGGVYAISLQPDNRILLGGEFIRCSGVTRSHITRLNPDGSVDPTINFGYGCDNYVSCIAVQPDDHILLGGGFTTYDRTPAPYLARIFGRSVAGSGTFEFTSATFAADETATNALLTLRRRGGTSATTSGPNVSVTVSVTDGTAVSGVNYLGGFYTNTFAPGETFQDLRIPVTRDFVITPDLTAYSLICDIQPLGLADGIGNQPFATLIINNVDSGVRFSKTAYSIAEDAQQARATISVERFGSTRQECRLDFRTTFTGTAAPYLRFMPTNSTVVFAEDQTSQNVFVDIANDSLINGNQTVGLELANPLNTILAFPAEATLTIIDDDEAPGIIQFSSPVWTVSEKGTNVTLTVIRSNGFTGEVTVDYSTQDDTASAGIRYAPTNGTLIFAHGDTLKTIVVPILDTGKVEGNQSFLVSLTNVTGGALLGAPASASVTVLDDDVGLDFSWPSYSVNETGDSFTVTVIRQGTNGYTTVSCATTNGTALAGLNFDGLTNTLAFQPGEVLKSFPVYVHHDPRITGDLFFKLALLDAFDPYDPSAQIHLGPNNPATVTVGDMDPGVAFATNSLFVLKDATNVLVTVVRSNVNAGPFSIRWATTNNGTASPGIDYVAAGGVLSFTDASPSQTFAVPIINNGLFQGNRTFDVYLYTNAQSGVVQLLQPTNATVTIIDNVAALSFAQPSFSAPENAGAAMISILRSGYSNSTVAVDFATTANLTPQAAGNYLPTNMHLVFYPGQMATNVPVTLFDRGLLNGDQIVQLSLANPAPAGRTVLLDPLSVPLTIREANGSYILSAGTALIAESGPANGVIDPGEQVSLFFALRNAAGTNTANLTATLLATNGISNPSSPRDYGVLAVRGPSASRQFSFTANGTNGQTIAATFLLQDGAFTSYVIFPFILGQSVATFSNTAAISIQDNTSAAPYPSTIDVSGLGGVVARATVTLTNFNHSWPRDVDVLLVSPTGQKSYLMAKCGGSLAANNVTLTFDDASLNALPLSSALVSGTYHPTAFAAAPPPFPAPAPPPPYSTNLSAFNGYSPNGLWSLFVFDDAANHFGAVSNGWLLSFITANKVSSAADLVTALTAAPEPVVVHSNITYSISVTNFGPSTAANVVLANSLPAGTAFVPAASSPGVDTSVPGLLLYRLGDLPKDAVTNLTITALTTVTNVTVTNVAWALSETPDLNPLNNTNRALTTITNFASDLRLTLAVAPDPVFLGNTLAFTITVFNAGPATALALAVTNFLPAELSFVSAAPADACFTYPGLVAFNLGDLPAQAITNLTLVARAVALPPDGLLWDSATAASAFIDPLKENNSDSVKVLVLSLPISVTRPGPNSIRLSWPAAAGPDCLQSTASLTPPVIWTPVSSPLPALQDDCYTITLGTTNGTRFFRLQGPNP